MEARSRSASLASSLPLGLIALCFFLPSVRSCSVMHSPIEYCDTLAMAGWIVPPFAAAAALCLLTVFGLLCGRAPRPIGGAAALAIAALAPLGLLAALSWRLPSRLSESAWFMAGCALALLLGAVAAGRARHSGGWRRWRYLLLAYVPLSLPAGIFMFGAVYDQLFHRRAEPQAGPGAWLYCASLIAMAVVLGAAGISRRSACAPGERPEAPAG